MIAAINGAAVGLGCSLAALCDIVLMSETAYLADPHVSVGLVAGDGGAAFWPLLTPIMRSREYLYTGDRIRAATAVELGLATRTTSAVPEISCRSARALAERLAAQPAVALQGTKRVLGMYLSGPLSPVLCRQALLQRASPCGLASTASECSLLRQGEPVMSSAEITEFRDAVSQWCQGHVPTGWREAQTGASDEEFVAFQRAWFAELRKAGFAVPHWPREWGGGLTIPEQVVLYSQLAAH